MTIISRVVDEIDSDDCDESVAIREKYLSATAEQRALIDDIFISLCGYGLDTIIKDEGDLYTCDDCRNEWFADQLNDGDTCLNCGGRTHLLPPVVLRPGSSEYVHEVTVDTRQPQSKGAR